MAERFLVIGSNSFSGASFVAGALAEGAEVVGVSRSAEFDDVFLPYKWQDHDKFRFAQIDMNGQFDELKRLLGDFAPEYVVNFAAQGMVAQSWQQPEQWYQTNVVAMAKLHEAVRQQESVKKFVHASTPEIYGSTSGLIPESNDYNPSTPYAVSKAACDMNLMAYHKAYDFPVCLTRSANVCGPAQALYRIIPKTIWCVLSGEKLRLEGGGTSVRSFIHIRDVVDATISIARNGKPGEVFHLSTKENVSIRDLVEEIVRQLDADFDKSVEVAPARLGQDSAYLLDSTKARTQLNWTPKWDWKEAVADTIKWMRDHFDDLRSRVTEYQHKA